MTRETRRTYNERLPPLPGDDEVLAAVGDLIENERRSRDGATANLIAAKLGVQGARRLGRGAVAHSWSGTMSAALRIAPRLRSLTKQGLLDRRFDHENYRSVYTLTTAGRERIGA